MGKSLLFKPLLTTALVLIVAFGSGAIHGSPITSGKPDAVVGIPANSPEAQFLARAVATPTKTGWAMVADGDQGNGNHPCDSSDSDNSSNPCIDPGGGGPGGAAGPPPPPPGGGGPPPGGGGPPSGGGGGPPGHSRSAPPLYSIDEVSDHLATQQFALNTAALNAAANGLDDNRTADIWVQKPTTILLYTGAYSFTADSVGPGPIRGPRPHPGGGGPGGKSAKFAPDPLTVETKNLSAYSSYSNGWLGLDANALSLQGAGGAAQAVPAAPR